MNKGNDLGKRILEIVRELSLLVAWAIRCPSGKQKIKQVLVKP
jgi:hypothetical protein